MEPLLGDDAGLVATLAAEQVLQQLRGQGGGLDVLVRQAGPEVPGQVRCPDVPDHFPVHVPVTPVPVLVAEGVVGRDHVLVAFVDAVAGEVLHRAGGG
jgi:hypothetical protein